VYELLADNGMDQFYQMNAHPGNTQRNRGPERWDYLDAPGIADALYAFADEHMAVWELELPAIHCSSCIWLLEHLYKLNPGVKQVVVNFPRRRARITFSPAEITPGNLAALLARIGYPPNISAGSKKTAKTGRNPLVTKLGIAAFGFGNIMIMALPEYLEAEEPTLQTLLPFFRYLSLALALPVVFYSAADYFKTAWAGRRNRYWNLDQPIALGIAAIFMQSTLEVVTGMGSGYWDSLTGLVFFLLLGKWFQRKTYEALAFDRDIESFFPLTATRLQGDTEQVVPLAELKPGDEILVRNEEIVPADAVLISASTTIDNSFITGESQLVRRTAGQKIYAGARQKTGSARYTVIQSVDQSQLTSLWAATGNKRSQKSLENITDQYSRLFTPAILTLALGSGVVWAFIDPSKSVWVTTAVLIVACPCALALSAPFAMGNAMRRLGRRGIYLKNTEVLERMSQINTVVFDKTGTLTLAGKHAPNFSQPLDPDLEGKVRGLAATSNHPLSKILAQQLHGASEAPQHVEEIPGAGLVGTFPTGELKLGSAVLCQAPALPPATRVHLMWNGQYVGHFTLEHSYRKGLRQVIQSLQTRARIVLLTGDGEQERPALEDLFGTAADLRFQQSPTDKFQVVQVLQNQGGVMMVGDGLNDTGALAQSDVGVAVAEDASAFTPASDVIMSGQKLTLLEPTLRYALSARSIVYWGFRISLAYNIIGLFFAMTGQLAPVVCAILMPLSSISVVAFATAATAWKAHMLDLHPDKNQ
jgi:Cu+-exporting ATPase